MLATFQQLDANRAVLSGLDFVRMTQFAASAGDIYESTQGCHAFGIGPLSDFENYNVVYFDEAQDTLLSQLSIGPGRPFQGRLDARNPGTGEYLPAKRPGRILIYPQDLWNAQYLPVGFNPVQDRLIFETPVIDVIQYFTPTTNPASKRTDKIYEYSQLPFALDDVYVCIPYYGRKSANIYFRNDTDQIIDIAIDGLSFTLTEDGPRVTSIAASAPVAVGASTRVVVIAQTAGSFDYLQITLHPAAVPSGLSPLRITTSDSVSG